MPKQDLQALLYSVTPVSDVVGDDEEDTTLLREMATRQPAPSSHLIGVLLLQTLTLVRELAGSLPCFCSESCPLGQTLMNGYGSWMVIFPRFTFPSRMLRPQGMSFSFTLLG